MIAATEDLCDRKTGENTPPPTLKNIAVPVPPSLPSRCFNRFFPALLPFPPFQVINLDVEDGKLGTELVKNGSEYF